MRGGIEHGAIVGRRRARVLSPRYRRVSFRIASPSPAAIDPRHRHRHGLDIAIVGAGTAGLALAALLGRTHRVTVFEQSDAAQPAGAGLLLQPSGMQVLQRMGLLARLLELGDRIGRLHGTLPDRDGGRSGRTVLDLHYRDVHEKAFGLGLTRDALFDALHDAALRSGAAIVCGQRIEALEQDAAGVRLAGDRRRARPFDACIVAAGAFSALRGSVGIRHEARPYAWGALWALVPDRPRAFDGVLRQWYAGTRRMLGLMPSGLLGRRHAAAGDDSRRMSLFWSVREDRLAELRERPIARWRDEAAALAPAAAPYLDLVDDWPQLRWARYADVRMPRPWHGRVLFIGDSAHGTSPQLGQGANLALVDALVLASALAGCGADAGTDAIAAAFARYGAMRSAHVRYYQRASRWLTPLFQSDSASAAWLRNLCIGPLTRAPLLRGQVLHTLTGSKTGLLGRLRLPV